MNFKIHGSFATTAAISSASIGAGSDNAKADYDGIDILTSAEIHFTPTITLDNGITIGADVELEGNTSSDQIDESTIFAKGAFGKIELGSKDSAGKQLQVGAPDNSLVYAVSTSLTALVPFDGPSKGDFASDANRLTYFTPDLGGFQFGVSYARSNSQTNGVVDNNAEGAGTDYADIGFAYNGPVGGVDVSLSARYGTYSRNMKPTAAAAALTASTAARLTASTAHANYDAAAEEAEEYYDPDKAHDTSSTSLYGKLSAAYRLPNVAARAAAIDAAKFSGALATAEKLPQKTDEQKSTRDAAIAAAHYAENGLNKIAVFEKLPDDVPGKTDKADAKKIVQAIVRAQGDDVSNQEDAADALVLKHVELNAAETPADRAASARGRPTIAGVGLKLGFGGGVSIGGGYVERDDKDGLSETKTYDIGVGYVNGPTAYSLTYVHDEQTGVSENELWVAAAKYTVNPNFSVGASLSAFDTDKDGSSPLC